MNLYFRREQDIHFLTADYGLPKIFPTWGINYLDMARFMLPDGQTENQNPKC